jgi:hypothetical protein
MSGPEIGDSDGTVRRGEVLSPSEVPALGLDGMDLDYFVIDFRVGLQFGQIVVTIESPFRLSVNGETRTFDPSSREDLGPVLAIYPATVVTATIEPDATLRMVFEGGFTIEVPQDPQYEAWQLAGPGKQLIVCPPEDDGTLAVWR